MKRERGTRPRRAGPALTRAVLCGIPVRRDGVNTCHDESFPWLDDVDARGIRLDGDRLAPTSQARTVAVRDGEMLVSDGPFAETKEVICGYDILECDSIEEAVLVAAAHPVAAFGRIEVRPFWK